MVSSPAQNPAAAVPALVSSALQQGILSRRDHLLLATTLLSNPALTHRDRQGINRVFDGICLGRVRIVD